MDTTDGGSLDNSVPEHVIDMVTDSERNVYVISQVGEAGLTIDGNPKTYWGDNTTLGDVALASFACDGTYRWSKIIGGASVEIVKSVQVDSQDNVYIVGNFLGYQSTQYPPRIDNDYIMSQSPADARMLFLAKFDKEGVFQWIKRPQAEVIPSTDTPNTGSYEMYIANDIIYWFVTLESGTYADGAFTTGAYSGYQNFVFKYDINGNFIDATHLNWVSVGGALPKMYRNPYNGYYYLMYRKNGSTTVVSVNGVNIENATFIACYNDTGVFQWLRESNTNNSYDVTLHGLAFDPSNNIYVAGKMTGYTISGASFLGFTIPIDEIPAFILKVNPTADTLLWSSYVTTPSSSENIGGLLYHNNIVSYTGSATGENYNFSGGSLTLNINPIGTNTEILFSQFDAETGSTLLLSKITGDSNNPDNGTAIAVDSNGDYLVGGGFGHYIYDANGNQNINAGGRSDFFVAKYSTGACNPLSMPNMELDKVQVYPNPAKDVLYIIAQEPIEAVRFYNILGQEVLYKEVAMQESVTVEVGSLVSGSYFVKVIPSSVFSKGRNLKTVMFVKE